jgi:hypothetical protein
MPEYDYRAVHMGFVAEKNGTWTRLLSLLLIIAPFLHNYSITWGSLGQLEAEFPQRYSERATRIKNRV